MRVQSVCHVAFRSTEHKDDALPSLLFSEVLYEDEGFRSRQFAALVASKVFYHLGAFEESLNYALGAGDLFNVNDNSEYVETIIGKQLLLPKKSLCVTRTTVVQSFPLL